MDFVWHLNERLFFHTFALLRTRGFRIETRIRSVPSQNSTLPNRLQCSISRQNWRRSLPRIDIRLCSRQMNFKDLQRVDVLRDGTILEFLRSTLKQFLQNSTNLERVRPFQYHAKFRSKEQWVRPPYFNALSPAYSFDEVKVEFRHQILSAPTVLPSFSVLTPKFSQLCSKKYILCAE